LTLDYLIVVVDDDIIWWADGVVICPFNILPPGRAPWGNACQEESGWFPPQSVANALP